MGWSECPPYAFVQDVASSWEPYEHITAGLIEPGPPPCPLLGGWRSRESLRDHYPRRDPPASTCTAIKTELRRCRSRHHFDHTPATQAVPGRSRS